MNDYLAKPIDEEKLHNLLLRYKPGHIGGTYTLSAEPVEISVNQNATFDWQLALRRAGKPDLAREMLQMLVAFLPEIRNKVEEQLVGENPEELLQAIHKLHGSCGYSGVPRLKTSASCWSSSYAQGHQNLNWNRSSLSCWMRWIT